MPLQHRRETRKAERKENIGLKTRKQSTKCSCYIVTTKDYITYKWIKFSNQKAQREWTEFLK